MTKKRRRKQKASQSDKSFKDTMGDDENKEAIAALRRNAKPTPSLNLCHNKVENWKAFKVRWNNYTRLSSLNKIPQDLQVAQLQNCLGDDALKALSAFHFTTDEANRTTKQILDAFETYVIGQVNETLERCKFGKRNQMEGEEFNKYLAELRRMIQMCGYCNYCEPSILRDRIMHGILNDDTREDLLKKTYSDTR